MAEKLTAESMKKLRNGDLVKHRLGPEVFVVTGNYGERVTAVRTVDITNPGEWEHIKPWSPLANREGR